MSDCRQCVDCEWCAEHEDCGLFNPKPTTTNADRIRAMKDEELANYFSELSCWPNAGREDCRGVANCMDCWLDWLKQEAKNDSYS